MPLTFRDRLILALDARLDEGEIEAVLDELADDLKEISDTESMEDHIKNYHTLTLDITKQDIEETQGTLMPVSDPNASFNLPK
jgi:hypothetical protein